MHANYRRFSGIAVYTSHSGSPESLAVADTHATCAAYSGMALWQEGGDLWQPQEVADYTVPQN